MTQQRSFQLCLRTVTMIAIGLSVGCTKYDVTPAAPTPPNEGSKFPSDDNAATAFCLEGSPGFVGFNQFVGTVTMEVVKIGNRTPTSSSPIEVDLTYLGLDDEHRSVQFTLTTVDGKQTIADKRPSFTVAGKVLNLNGQPVGEVGACGLQFFDSDQKYTILLIPDETRADRNAVRFIAEFRQITESVRFLGTLKEKH